MKNNFFKKAFMMTAAFALLSHTAPGLPANAEEQLKDSGITYTETIETINNPGIGYTQTVWSYCRPGETPVHNPTGSIVLFFIDIGQFSSGINESGTDYDLDEAFFTAWRQTFENCRKNGCMAALRFRYDGNGADNPEPATFDKVLEHISQIKESGILEEYKDILAFVESGFVGKWGEQHGGKYVSTEYKAKLLDAMLDCVPSPVPVTVRTPDTFAKWAGIGRKDLASYHSEPGSQAARVGLYDDGYMGSNSDLGTYANRETETQWLGNQTIYSYFGGEFSGNIEFAKQFDTYLPENAVPEMYNTHLSYINGNIFQLYKDHTFNEKNDIKDVRYQTFPENTKLEKTYDHSAYYGQNVFRFIRDHLGYRYVLRLSELSESVSQGEELTLHFKVENTGFANAVSPQKAELIIEQNGQYMKTPVDITPVNWRSCTVADETVTAKLPDSLPEGNWNAYLKISQGENKINQMHMRSVRFANKDIWHSSLGANYLGTFTVTESASKGTENSLVSGENSSDKMYRTGGQISVDGISTPDEWSEEKMISENGENKLYMTADEKYIYVMAKLPAKVDAAVYNLQITNDETGKFYWMYYTSGGFVYFNNGSYDGCICKWSGDTVEYRVPFEVMGLAPGTKLRSVRVSLQDSANGWVCPAEIKSGQYTVPSDFCVYTGEKSIRLSSSETHTLSVETTIDSPEYKWFFNDEQIQGADASEYTITASPDCIGKYSVLITSENNISKTVPVCSVLEVLGNIKGDINSDGLLDMRDILILQKHLLYGKQPSQLHNADMNDDGLVNIIDLCMLKYQYIISLFA